METNQAIVDSLKEKLRIVQLENEQLTERAEDSLMLGLISEIIQPLFERNDILDAGLERISLLKRVPLVACSTIENNTLKIHKSYLTISHNDIDNAIIHLNAAQLEKLNAEEVHVEHLLLDDVLTENKIEFSPKQIMLIPFFQSEDEKFVFIFADTETDSNRFYQMLPMLTQVTELLISTIHHCELLDKYRQLNIELDKKVEERTRALDKTVKALSESESRFRSLVEQAADAFFVIDMKGNFIDVNKQACKSLGYSKKELLQMSVADIDEDFTHEKASGVFEHISDHGSYAFKATHTKKNGGTFPVEINVSVLKMDDQQFMLAIARDVSELKLLEQQFHHAQKMEALGTLVGGIAHDFNNMLAGMTGNLYLARKKAKDMPDVVQKLANVERLSFRAADMIQQLLTFARKGQVEMKQIPLNPFIKETLKLLRASVPENIALHHNICSDSLLINGDGTQLHQVIMNLIHNARDAIEGVDSPCVTVRLERFQPDDAFMASHSYFKPVSYARLCVEDNGCGIPENQIEHLFEPFFTTKEQGKGTGLGLAMVFGAIKTHHGYVEVESIENKGSTFHIYLPLLEIEEIASTPLQDETIAEGSGETILLVDDDVQILETGGEVLESLGYQVLKDSDGLDAVETFTAHQDKISLIIMDVVMPGLGGVKSVERIRKIDPDVKVIFATGYDKNTSLPDAIDTSKVAVLSKPYNIETLSKAIRKQLDS